MRILHEVQRIDRIVDHIAEQVTHGGRPDQRNEQIGAGMDAIATQGVAERTEVVRQAGGPGDIDHPANPDGGIGDETHRRRAGPGRTKLQHVVDEHHRLAEVDEHMVDGPADWPRGKGAIEDPDDPESPSRQGQLDGEPAPVEAFEGIVHGRSRVRRADPAQHGDGHGRGGEPAVGCRLSAAAPGIEATNHGFGRWRRHGCFSLGTRERMDSSRRPPSARTHILAANRDSIESGESEHAFMLLQAWPACRRRA